MSVLLWSLFAAALLVVLSKGPAMKYMAQSSGGYDNRHPREQQSQLSGPGARALAAHQNTIENFPLFAAGVLVAELAANPNTVTALLAVGFLVMRVAYIVCYVKDWSTPRSVVWGLGYFACLGLLLAPLYAG